MLIEIQCAITAALAGLAGFRTTGVWQGEIEELLNNPAQKLPSAHVLFSSAEFDAPSTIGAIIAPSDTLWSVVIISQNLRDRKSGDAESLSLIEQAVSALTRLDTGHGWLWPVRAQLIGAENGKSAYGLHCIVESNP